MLLVLIPALVFVAEEERRAGVGFSRLLLLVSSPSGRAAFGRGGAVVDEVQHKDNDVRWSLAPVVDDNGVAVALVDVVEEKKRFIVRDLVN